MTLWSKNTKQTLQHIKDFKNFAENQFLLLMRQLKLIWDFKGPDGAKTAQHHAIHLKEFTQANHYDHLITGSEVLHEMHAIAYMIVPEDEMASLRDALKPHRGQVYSA